MSLLLFTLEEKQAARNDDFKEVKEKDISQSCPRATASSKRVLLRYYEGALCNKNCKVVVIVEISGITLLQLLKFDPSHTDIPREAAKTLERAAAWNGIKESELIRLILEESPWVTA